jgi:hypothetical protein
MTNRKAPPRDDAWIVADIAPHAQEAAEQAAATSGMPLEIWLAETVLRASQEGIGGETASDLPLSPATKS